MNDVHEASSEGGAPEYMVSYADMLTILLAFFIVLYASAGTTGAGKKGQKAGQGATAQTDNDHGSGPRQSAADKPNPQLSPEEQQAENERMRRVFESLRYRFGPEWTISNCWTGGPPELRGSDANRRTPGVYNLGKGTWGRTGDEHAAARALRPGEHLLIGGRIYFDDFSATLNDPQILKLRGAVEQLAGKMQRIEIRGHASRLPLPADCSFRDRWDLAYARCRAVEAWVVEEGIDPRRIRLSVAGDNEPVAAGGDEIVPVEQNSRVEIRLLNEFVAPPSGSGSDNS